ncbi:MAG: DUF58 domain-containing protein [Acidobacteriota bacterium]
MFGWLRRHLRLSTTAPSRPVAPTLPADLMRKVRRIEISTNRLVDQGVAGNYHSAFKGRGVEFAEVRPYIPGDDVRNVDWNVSARMNDLYIKRFVEERDLTVFVVMDVSGSLGYGSRTILKRELAAEIAALLSFAAVRNQDRVGCALISDRLEFFLRPDRRRTHVLRLVREILMHPGGGSTDLERGLWATLKTLRQRSVLFVISDFLDSLPTSSLKAAAARHDVVVIELVDPRDHRLPDAGPVVLQDAETGRMAVVDGRRLADEHAARRQRDSETLRTLVRQLGIGHLEIRTDRPYLSTLVSFFERRRRRLRR